MTQPTLIGTLKNKMYLTGRAAITFAAKTGPNSQKLTYLGSGNGGTTELKTKLADDAIIFALVRVTDKIDNSVTVKFIWVNWLGNSVGRMMKARLSTQLGSIQDFIGVRLHNITTTKPQQHHLSHQCSSQDEISHTILMEKVMGTSGSGSKVLDSTGVCTILTCSLPVQQAQFRVQAASSPAATASTNRGPRKADDEATFHGDCSTILASVRSGESTWYA